MFCIYIPLVFDMAYVFEIVNLNLKLFSRDDMMEFVLYINSIVMDCGELSHTLKI